MIQYLKDREDSIQFTAYSILSSLLQSPTSRIETMDMMDKNMAMSSSLSIQTVYPISLKLIFTKYKHLIDLIFNSIETATSSKVRSYAIQCVTLMLSSYFQYKEIKQHKIKNIGVTEEKKQEFEDEESKEEEEEDLDSLMEEYVIKYRTKMKNNGYLLDHTFLWQCLSDNTGDPDFYKSVSQLFQILIKCDINQVRKSVYLQKNGDRLKYLLQINAYKMRYDQHMIDLNIPNYLKSSVALNDEWNKFEGEIKSIRAISDILQVFNATFDNMEDKEQHIIFELITSEKHNLNIANYQFMY